MYKILEKYKIPNHLMDEIVAYYYMNDYKQYGFMPFSETDCVEFMEAWEIYQNYDAWPKAMPCFELHSNNSENSVYVIIIQIKYDEPVKVSDINVLHDKVLYDKKYRFIL